MTHTQGAIAHCGLPPALLSMAQPRLCCAAAFIHLITHADWLVAQSVCLPVAAAGTATMQHPESLCSQLCMLSCANSSGCIDAVSLAEQREQHLSWE